MGSEPQEQLKRFKIMVFNVYRFRLCHSGRELVASFESKEDAQALVKSEEGSSETTVKNKDLIKSVGHWFLAWEEENLNKEQA